MKVASTNEGDSMVIEVPLTKHRDATTKHRDATLKGPTQVMAEDGPVGASGDYTVTVTCGKQIPISGAIAIRVLDHGELNLLTDAGRWYLFAPNEWKTAFPTQPTPGNSTDK